MPQVQFLDQPTWGQALGQFGSSAMEGYKGAREEDALSKLLERTKGMEEEDALKEYFKAKGIGFEKKKTIADVMSKAAERKDRSEDRKAKVVEARKLVDDKAAFEKDKFEFEKEKTAESDRIKREKIAADTKAASESTAQKTEAATGTLSFKRDELSQKKELEDLDRYRKSQSKSDDIQQRIRELDAKTRADDLDRVQRGLTATSNREVADARLDLKRELRIEDIKQKNHAQQLDLEQQRSVLEQKEQSQVLDRDQRASLAKGKADLTREIKQLEIDNREIKQSKFDEVMEDQYAKEYQNAEAEVSRIKYGIENLNELKSIQEKIKGTEGYANFEARTEFDSRATAALEPIIKIYNPAGVISQPKLDYIDKNFKPKSGENHWSTNGKIAGLEALYENQMKRYQERMQIIRDHNFKPPFAIMNEHDEETVKSNDAVIGFKEEDESPQEGVGDLPDPASNKGRKLEIDGVIHESDGGKWLPI